jgi:putative two-component system response regulator
MAAPAPPLAGDTILVIDDQPTNVRLLEQMLRIEGYANVTGVTDPRRAPDLFAGLRPDLVLLDLHMPHVGGIELLARFRAMLDGEYLPIIVLTADDTPETKLRALEAGATDFLTKPFDHSEAVLRIRHLLEARALHVRLEERVADRTRELEDARLETLERLALAAEFRDDDTHAHTQRVGHNAARLAQALGLPPSEVEVFRAAAPLHDVGKIGVSDTILLKPGKLTEEEFEHMKGHTEIGARILAASRSQVLRLGEQIALSHHERWDGSGYPRRLRGEEIPFAGRLVSVVDVFDALTHARPYKRAWPIDRAEAEMRSQAGSAFDPALVEVFLELVAAGAVDAR